MMYHYHLVICTVVSKWNSAIIISVEICVSEDKFVEIVFILTGYSTNINMGYLEFLCALFYVILVLCISLLQFHLLWKRSLTAQIFIPSFFLFLKLFFIISFPQISSLFKQFYSLSLPWDILFHRSGFLEFHQTLYNYMRNNKITLSTVTPAVLCFAISMQFFHRGCKQQKCTRLRDTEYWLFSSRKF